MARATSEPVPIGVGGAERAAEAAARRTRFYESAFALLHARGTGKEEVLVLLGELGRDAGGSAAYLCIWDAEVNDLYPVGIDRSPTLRRSVPPPPLDPADDGATSRNAHEAARRAWEAETGTRPPRTGVRVHEDGATGASSVVLSILGERVGVLGVLGAPRDNAAVALDAWALAAVYLVTVLRHTRGTRELLRQQEDLVQSNARLAALLRELEYRQRVIERLNGELQSGNARLEESLSELRRTQGRLEEARDAATSSLSLLQATLEATADGILAVDNQSAVLNYNKNFLDIWKISASVMTSRETGLASIRDQVKNPQAFIARIKALHGSEEDSFDLLELRDGRVIERVSRPQRAGDRVVGRVWSFHDVTERTRAEQEIRDLTIAMQNAVEGISRIDADGRYASVNEAYAQMTGYLPEELVGTAWERIVHPESASSVRDAFARMQRNGKAEIEALGLTKDGTSFHVRLLIVSAVDARGMPSGHHAFMKDIGDHKRMQASLLLADRLASVGTLSAGVAHEINNPLAYVLGNLDVLTEQLADPSFVLGEADLREIGEIVAETREGATRMRSIVRDLKMFSRLDDAQRGPVDVTALLEFSIKMATNEMRHRARLVREFSPVPAVEANEGQLSQVFLNLLVNAAQAIPEGAVDDNEIRVVTRRGGASEVIVEVHDTGSGILAQHLPQIFDPFFTTKPVGVGTGLGLSVCHGIIKALGGSLSVESEVGKGSVFRIALPAKAEAKREPSPPPDAALRRGQVLVIDDEPKVALAIRRMLLRDHDVVVCHAATEALDLVKNGARFDVILCDVMMPTMTGIDFHAALGAVAPDQAERVAFMTGGAFSALARNFLDSTTQHRFEKPIDLKELRGFIRNALR